MPNHFEINSSGFDSLLSDEPTTQQEPSTMEGQSEYPDNDTTLTQSSKTVNVQEEPEENSGEPVDFLTSFLSEYGVQNGKVTYENEDGTTEEVDFSTLDDKEKVNILKELTSPNLSKDEVGVINYLRSNNATIQDVIDYYSTKAVEEYVSKNGTVEQTYEIDSYTDDELYIADLKSKFEDMTDEEIKSDLELAKEKEDLFKKKVDIIRKQYKAQEEEKVKELETKKEEQFTAFRNSLGDQLKNFNNISMDYKDGKSDRLQIEDEEKEEIYRYVLEQDETGASKFFKDLNNPEKIVEMAWFALYGKDAISDITNYWKSQLKSTRKPESTSQTTVVPSNKKDTKDNFTNHRNVAEAVYGEHLL